MIGTVEAGRHLDRTIFALNILCADIDKASGEAPALSQCHEIILQEA